MNKRIRIFTVALTIMMLCLTICTSSFASASIPAASSDFYVNDFAGVFTPEEKALLMDKAVTLSNKSDGIQVVISTIKSLEGDSVENYALNMYNKYGIGKNDMGLLILLATEDRQIRVEVGKSMEAYINDSKAGRFMDKYAVPYLKENKFNEGLISLQAAFVDEITSAMSSKADTAPTSSSNSASSGDFTFIFGILGFLLFIAIIIYTIWLISKKIQKRKNHINQLNIKISELTNQNNNLIQSHNVKVSELNKTIAMLNKGKNSLQSKLSETENKLLNLTDRHNRTLKIYPDADKKVDAMIKAELIEKDKQAANSVDSLISSVINLSASKDIVDKLSSVISRYSLLTKSQKEYITSDITKLNTLYNNSVKLKEDYEAKLEEERIQRLIESRKAKAASVTKEILAIISLIGIANARDLSRLKNAKRLFDNLDYDTQQYVDDSVISKLNSLISAAKRDQEEEEAAERRRRQSSYHSSSTFRSSSSSFRGGGFGGFGGRSGGGGASRGF